MPRLILLNGPPACGKSTLAALYADRHPLTANLDIDRIRSLIGGWRDDASTAGLLARAIVLAGARAHLSGGRDVVIPQLVARIEFLEQLDDLARETGAEFHEIVLMGGKRDAIRRFAERSATAISEMARSDAPPGGWSEYRSHLDSHRMVELGGGDDHLAETYDRLVNVLALRPYARQVRPVAGKIEAAYAAMITIIES